VVSTRQLTAAKEDRKGILDTAREIVDEFGVFGLWKGLRATLVLCVNLAITYGATERLRILLFQGRAKLQPWESFSECASLKS
jgi:transmembrane carrier protein